jgi:hypothetical protein
LPFLGDATKNLKKGRVLLSLFSKQEAQNIFILFVSFSAIKKIN